MKHFLILGFFALSFQVQAMSLPKPNGQVIVQDEMISEEQEQVRVRITGGAALILCSSLGIQLQNYEGQSYIQSKGSYTCLTTKNKGEFIAGHIVSRSGEVRNLEVDGYE